MRRLVAQVCIVGVVAAVFWPTTRAAVAADASPSAVAIPARVMLQPRRNPLTVDAVEPVVVVSAPSVTEIVRAAALRRGADAAFLLRVAFCESRLDPNAVGDHGDSLGLFQFHVPSGTWAANSARYGWAGASAFDPVAASDVAAAMFARGQSHLWTCAR